MQIFLGGLYRRRFNEKMYAKAGLVLFPILLVCFALISFIMFRESLEVLDPAWPGENIKTIHLKLPEAEVYENSVRFYDLQQKYSLPEKVIGENAIEFSERMIELKGKPAQFDLCKGALGYKWAIVRLKVDGEMIVSPEKAIPRYREMAQKGMWKATGAAGIASLYLILFVLCLIERKKGNLRE